MSVYRIKVIDHDFSGPHLLTGIFAIPPNRRDLEKVIQAKKEGYPRITRVNLHYKITLNAGYAPVSVPLPPEVTIKVGNCRGENKTIKTITAETTYWTIFPTGYKIDAEGDIDITEEYNCVNQPFGLNTVQAIILPGSGINPTGHITIEITGEVIGI